MKNKFSGQVTLETAIIMPIVMIIVVTFVYISFYIHDVVSIKSYGYSLAMEYRDSSLKDFTEHICNGLTRTPLFIMKINAKCLEENDVYKVVIYSISKEKTGWIGLFFDKSEPLTVKVEKKINTDIIYASRAIFDKLE